MLRKASHSSPSAFKCQPPDFNSPTLRPSPRSTAYFCHLWRSRSKAITEARLQGNQAPGVNLEHTARREPPRLAAGPSVPTVLSPRASETNTKAGRLRTLLEPQSPKPGPCGAGFSLKDLGKCLSQAPLSVPGACRQCLALLSFQLCHPNLHLHLHGRSSLCNPTRPPPCVFCLHMASFPLSLSSSYKDTCHIGLR